MGKRYSTTSLKWLFIVIIYLICVLDILGWLFGIQIFKSVVLSWAPMRLITAICLILTATSLVIILKYPRNRNKLIFTKLFCIINVSIGFINSLVYYYAFKTGVEWQIFNLPILNLFFSPLSRMALLTGILFQLTGVIVFLLAIGNQKSESIAHSITLLVASICYLVPVSYLLGVTSMLSFLGNSVALNTGVAFCLICLIIFLIRPDTWLMKLYTSAGAGSIIARRLLPGIFIIPIIIAFFRLLGERLRFFDSETGVVLVAVSYTFCLLLLVWHNAQSLNKKEEGRKITEEALRQSEENFKTILDATQESIYLFDRQGKFIVSNSIGAKRVNLPVNDIIGHHFREFMSPDLAVSRMEHLNRVFTSGKPEHFEDMRNGMTFRHYFYPCYKEDQVHYVATYSHDITEIKKKELELIRLNRVLIALSKSSQAMMKACDEKSYLKEICKIVVEDCKLAMVWIGYARNDVEKTVEPVAFSGFDKGYLEKLNISWADNEAGRGPTGTAIRTGKPAVCKNMLTDPSFTPWRQEAIKRGYASSLVLPLLDNEVAFGALTIYSNEPDPFAEKEVDFLAELASDLNYGILMLRSKKIREMAEEALQESEKRYRSLFNSLIEGFCTIEMVFAPDGKPVDYRFIEVNSTFEEQTGLKSVQGKLISELVPENEAYWYEIYGKVALTGEPVHFENETKGLNKWFDIRAFRVGGQESRRVAICFNNITVRKKAEEALQKSEHQFRLLFETMLQGAVYQDENGRIVSMNPAAQEILGQTLQEILNNTSSQIKHQTIREDGSPFPEVEYPALVSLRTGKKISNVIMGVYNPQIGDYRWISIDAVPIFRPGENVPYQVYSLFSDITQRVKDEKEKKIADEQLKNYATYLKEANATKDKLFSVIAHDLRGPFTSLLGFSDLLIENINSYDIEKIEKIIFRINSAAKSAFVLLENLLIWARSHNGHLLFVGQKINIALKIKSVLESLISLALIKNIQVKYTGAEDVMGYADENMFNAIIRNLISNAIKFSYPEGEIEITAISKEKHVEIVVSDNGIGMNDEMKNKLFKLNGNISLTGTAHEKGTGLGLLICNEFIEKHGGRIWAESKLGHGSKFFFTLPHPD